MALAVKGNNKKVRELRDTAEKEGLEIVYYSDNPDFLREFGEKSSYSDEDIIKLSRQHGIGRKAAEALYFIKKFGPLRQYEVAEKVSLDASTVSHHLKILQGKGLVEKDMKNKRETYYKSRI